MVVVENLGVPQVNQVMLILVALLITVTAVFQTTVVTTDQRVVDFLHRAQYLQVALKVTLVQDFCKIVQAVQLLVVGLEGLVVEALVVRMALRVAVLAEVIRAVRVVQIAAMVKVLDLIMLELIKQIPLVPTQAAEL